MNSKKKRILFVFHSFSAFVQNDYDLLSRHFRVDKYPYRISRRLLPFALAFVKQFFFLLIKGRKYDLYYCWFADYHSALPVFFSRFFKKKALVILGGYEVGRFIEYGYGVLTSRARACFSLYSMRKSTKSISVSRFVLRRANALAPKQEHTLVYNSVRLSPTENLPPKYNTLLTIAKVQSSQTFYIKGIDTFLQVARELPEVTFTTIGVSPQIAEKEIGELPSNVTFIRELPQEELVKHYQESKVYCQFSRFESFGLSLAESMLYGCIPVITNVGGMPEVVGACGHLVPRDPMSIARQINNILKAENLTLQQDARKRVLEHFMNTKREESLLKLLADLW